VIGDRYGTSCAPLLPDMVESTMSRLGYSVGRNKPYAGGFITDWQNRPLSLQSDGRIVAAGDRRSHLAALACLAG